MNKIRYSRDLVIVNGIFSAFLSLFRDIFFLLFPPAKCILITYMSKVTWKCYGMELNRYSKNSTLVEDYCRAIERKYAHQIIINFLNKVQRRQFSSSSFLFIFLATSFNATASSVSTMSKKKNSLHPNCISSKFNDTSHPHSFDWIVNFLFCFVCCSSCFG